MFRSFNLGLSHATRRLQPHLFLSSSTCFQRQLEVTGIKLDLIASQLAKTRHPVPRS